MARYKKRPQYGSPIPGLFDDFAAAPEQPGAVATPAVPSHEGDLSAILPDNYTATPQFIADFPADSNHTATEGRQKADTIFTEGDDFSPLETPMAPDRLNFISFGSGSSGNCAYLGDSRGGILIDAGVDADKVDAELRRFGIGLDYVRGILLTHDHSDHVRFVYRIVRKRPWISVYCTPRVLNGMLRRHNIARRIRDYHRAIYKEHPFTVGDFTVTAFEVQHDGSDNAGFFITHGRHRMAVATDLGCISERVDFYMRQANYIMLESNYDPTMLETGIYPEHLKARIRSGNGHLSNEEAAHYIAGIYTPELRHIFLCHLSKDNNTPELALHAVEGALTARGIMPGDGSGTPYARQAPVQLQALPRFDSTGLIVLR